MKSDDARRFFFALAKGDILTVLPAGAYGMVTAHTSITRPPAAEVMIATGGAEVIR